MSTARFLRTLIAALALPTGPALGQDQRAEQPAAAGVAPAADQPAFKPEELEQMLAPIALYPDSLISQILMASTYPIEVVEAERWIKAHKDLEGEALTAAVHEQTWDESVKSLVNFPDVLAMMSENLSTTVKIGDAFIGQQKEVMDTIQKLRGKAKTEGNLQSNQQQTVTVDASGGTEVIVIESSSPDVIYVPTYDSTIVYGGWPYPAYPPYPYYPPGYVASNAISFGVGVACGAIWANAWGDCDWHGADIDIDINRNANLDVNRERTTERASRAQQSASRGGGSFEHDPSHRQGAAYRNQASADRVGAGDRSGRTSQARNDYRGRAESGRGELGRGGADTRGTGQSPQADRGSGGGALGDANRGGDAARKSSSRGSSSRASSPSQGSKSSGSSRSGGGSRGGGGRGGGGRRR